MNRLPGLAAAVILASTLAGEDWPEWRGANRLGVWKETGILDEFPKEGLTFKWRAPIHGGFAGPSVAAGRVFVSDFVRGENTKGTERVLCLDEKTGKILWTQQWDADYIGLTPDVERELEQSADSAASATDLDRDTIARALADNGRSPTKAAKALGLKNRYVLLRLLKKHGLSVLPEETS